MTVVAIVAAMVFCVGVAHAAPPPGSTSPLGCLAEWDDNPDYVGQGWVSARVLDVGGVFLGCGDERSGMIHIAHPESTGTVHPIPPGQENVFLQCFQLVAQSGARRPDDDFPETRTRYEITYYIESQFGQLPQTATIVKDNAGRFVWTMFTSSGSFSPEGNNWLGCSNRVV